MKVKNNKGFVFTVVLYFLFIVYLALIANLLALMSTRRQILDKMKKEITKKEFEQLEKIIVQEENSDLVFTEDASE